MTVWLSAASNYIMIFLLALYVGAAYLSMWTRRFEAGFTRCMSVCRYLLHAYGYAALLLVTKDLSLIMFYLFQLLFFLVADVLQSKFFRLHIGMLYQNMQLLLAAGFLVLTRLSYNNAVKQFILAVAAYGICLLIPLVLRIFRRLEKLGWLYVLTGMGMLGVVLVLGSSVFGAKNWLTIRGVTFQPSEFVKLLFVLSMAALLVRKTEHKYRNLLLVSVVAALHVGMLALSNDFGGALIYFVVYLLMLFVVSADLLFPLMACTAGAGAAWLAYRYSGHIGERVAAWLDPFSCIEQEGYQVAQSLFAIGAGEWFGTGIAKGMPKTVPVVKSDFIFAAISEEFGAVFAVLLLCVYINCIIWMLVLALERKEPFYFAVTTGAAALFGVQLFLNVGGVIRLIPSTGVTLSFISYGGSALISTMILFQGIQGMCAVERSRREREAAWNLDDRDIEETRHSRKDMLRNLLRGRKNTEEAEEEWFEEHPGSRRYTGMKLRMILICTGILLGLCVMSAYYIGVTVPEARAVYNNDYNQRIPAKEKKVAKGKLLTSDGKILAHSVQGENGKLFRLYPYGAATAFITGRSSMGRTGLEDSFYYDMYTVSLEKLEQIKTEADGKLLEGDTVVTTIDSRLQQVAYEALSGYRGAACVMEVKTGRLLAYVSTPAYNPNDVSEAWNTLMEREDAPLLNRVTGGLYPPGSIFKIVTALAYLKEHPAEDFVYTCTGTSRVMNTTVHCYDETAHGKQTLKEAFAHSCNTAFAWMATGITDEVFNETAKELGFGIRWEDTLAYREDVFSLTEETSDSSRVQASFGQGETLITPYHALMLCSAIANDGVLQLPYLVERTQNCRGELLQQYASKGTATLMSKEEADILTDYMIAASELKMQELTEIGITVAGKTGSAEYSAESPAHSWYLCFAPADAPQIAVCVLMESAGTGSRYAAPAAKKILMEYFSTEP